MVATDFSKHASNAVRYAFGLAAANHAALIVLHVYTSPTADLNLSFAGHYSKTEARDTGQRKVDKILAAHLISHPAVKARSIVEAGTTDDIIRLATKYKVDTLVVGATGQGTIAGTLFGTTTSKLIGHAKCNVITIPARARFKGIKKMAVAITLARESIAIASDMIKVASQLKAEIMFLYIMPQVKADKKDAYPALASAIRQKSSYKPISFHVYMDSDVAHGLDTFISKNKPDILSMATHQRSRFEKLWRSSWTEKMSKTINIPLLAMHIGRDKTK